jgi:magnesium-transporting ATPase (P-type)
LAIILALAFTTKCMTHENLLVRVPGSCETMANASVICTDQTGSLTQNETSVVATRFALTASSFGSFTRMPPERTRRKQNSPHLPARSLASTTPISL